VTPHDHSTYVEGCYRCELSRDEADDVARSPADAVCEMCGDAAHYVLTDEALDFCADCAVSLLGEGGRQLRGVADKLASIARLLMVTPQIEEHGYDWPQIDRLLFDSEVQEFIASALPRTEGPQ
jgi:hypothetical protein